MTQVTLQVPVGAWSYRSPIRNRPTGDRVCVANRDQGGCLTDPINHLRLSVVSDRPCSLAPELSWSKMDNMSEDKGPLVAPPPSILADGPKFKLMLPVLFTGFNGAETP